MRKPTRAHILLSVRDASPMKNPRDDDVPGGLFRLAKLRRKSKRF